MSLNQIILDKYKPWLNARFNNIVNDGTFTTENTIINNNLAVQGELTTVGDITCGHDISASNNIYAGNRLSTDILQVGGAAVGFRLVDFGSGTLDFLAADNDCIGSDVNVPYRFLNFITESGSDELVIVNFLFSQVSFISGNPALSSNLSSTIVPLPIRPNGKINKIIRVEEAGVFSFGTMEYDPVNEKLNIGKGADTGAITPTGTSQILGPVDDYSFILSR